MERAVPYPRQQGTQPQTGAWRDRPDGVGGRPPRQRPRNGVGHLPPRTRWGSVAGALDRGRFHLVCVRRRSDGRRSPQSRWDRRRVASWEKRDRPHLPLRRSRTLTWGATSRSWAVRPAVCLLAGALRGVRNARKTAVEKRQRAGRPQREIAGRAGCRRGVCGRAPDERKDNPGCGFGGRRHLRGDDPQPLPRATGSRRRDAGLSGRSSIL